MGVHEGGDLSAKIAKTKLLLVDDEPDVTNSIKRLLRKEGYEIHTAPDAESGLLLLDEQQFDVVISDHRMPGMQGADFLTVVKDKQPNTTRMILSGYADFDAVTTAINNGAIFKFLSKPWDNETLKSQIREAVEHNQQKNINSQMGRIYNHLQDAVLITNGTGKVEFVNLAFERFIGVSRDEIIGQDKGVINNYFDLTSFQHEIGAALEAEKKWNNEILCIPPEKESLITELQITREVDPNTKLDLDIFIFKDISEQKAKLAHFETMFYKDVLSGLPNLFALKKHITEQIQEAQNKNDKSFTVVYVHFDRLKEYLNQFSQEETQEFIRLLTDMLPSSLKDNAYIGRYHDESFIIVSELGKILRLNDIPAIPETLTFQDKLYNLKIFMGLSYFPKDGESADGLINKAYSAEKIAEKNNNSPYQIYNAEIDNEINRNIKMENDLFLAQQNNEFAVFYQPLIDLKTGRIQKVEALLRWYHPTEGMVSPGQFIPVAEESGLILPIGEWVIHQACEEIRKLQENGFHDMSVAINLSPKQFEQDKLESILADAIKETNLKPSDIELEITEGVLMSNSDESAERLRELKKQGFKLSIDDFGTGYSSLSYLKFFPFDTLKIDQSFVRNILEDEVDEKIVDAITNMAQSLDLKIVAEGIETMKQYELLTNKQCDMGQGYLISKPLPWFELVKLLKKGWTP